MVRLYRRFVDVPPLWLPLPAMANGLLGAPRLPPPPVPFAAAAPPSRVDPKANVRPTRILSAICPGPRPKLRESSFSPEVGFGSSRPYLVATTPGLLESVAIPGRPLNRESPYRSRPAVMSNGGPEFAVSMGLKRIPHLGVMVPPKETRWCMSVAAGPYSPAML